MDMDHSRGAGGVGLVRPGGGALGPGLDDDRAVADDTWTVVARERLMREAERFSHVGSFSYCSASGALEWSDELFRIFGLDPATAGPLDASSFEAAIHPDDV
ncbi:MAG TPA: hypothetical protein PKK49_12405, partial [Flavobacteriales bacterium]|nr:hypothetical protein [Flavobacteriales bacterium]